MAGGRRARPRLDRARVKDDEQNEQDPIVGVLNKLKEALPDVTDALISDAKSNPEARKQLLDIMRDEISVARTSQASELLRSLADIRQDGSPMLEELWGKLNPAMKTFASPK